MRIDRQQSRFLFRKPPRRSGCLPLMLLLGVLVGVVVLSRDWLGRWFMLNLPGPTQASIQGAERAFAQGDLDLAVDQARAVLERQPDDTHALTFLARTLIYRSYEDYDHAKDRRAALDLTTQALDRLPLDGDLMALHALALHVNDESHLASRVALRVIDDEPENVLARVTLALAYGGQGLFQAALDNAQRAVRLADATVSERADWRMDARRALAIAHADRADYAEAVQIIDSAIRLHRQLIPLYFERAGFALQMGDVDSATAAYYQVMAFDPDNAKTHLRLCELSSELREPAAAASYCEEASQLAPSWSEAWYHLGREYYLQGRFDAALRALNRCTVLETVQDVPIEDRHFGCWYIQGQAAEFLGECETLRRLYGEFQQMAAQVVIPERWTYPPQGPPGCALTPSP